MTAGRAIITAVLPAASDEFKSALDADLTPRDIIRAIAMLRQRGYLVLAPDEVPPRCKRCCYQHRGEAED
jgi:hypothetical protein